jgi:hypothetical protein
LSRRYKVRQPQSRFNTPAHVFGGFDSYTARVLKDFSSKAIGNAKMADLPAHGKVDCSRCYGCNDRDTNTMHLVADDKSWRITHNPLAWGSQNPEIVVLGFSKGPTQAGATNTSPHDEIAYKGQRHNIAKIFGHIGLLAPDDVSAESISKLISDPSGRFHFGSLIRCTVERNEAGSWKGANGNMLSGFVGSDFGKGIAENCVDEHLGHLPPSVKLVLLFGYGANMAYFKTLKSMLPRLKKGKWQSINEVAYTDGKVTYVHLEHFASQGNLIPEWMGAKPGMRRRLGLAAKEAVHAALAPENAST